MVFRELFKELRTSFKGIARIYFFKFWNMADQAIWNTEIQVVNVIVNWQGLTDSIDKAKAYLKLFVATMAGNHSGVGSSQQSACEGKGKEVRSQLSNNAWDVTSHDRRFKSRGRAPGRGRGKREKMDGEIFVTRFKVFITFRVPLPRTGTRQQAHLYSGRALLRWTPSESCCQRPGVWMI